MGSERQRDCQAEEGIEAMKKKYNPRPRKKNSKTKKYARMRRKRGQIYADALIEQVMRVWRPKIAAALSAESPFMKYFRERKPDDNS